MLEGFTVGGKYVVEEKLVGGRLLCHDLGIEGNKRIVPLGSRVKNKLYTDTSGSKITVYDGVKIQAYNNSILTCCKDQDGLYLEGIFYMYTDCSGFCEGGIYIFKGIDAKGNIMVEDNQSSAIKKIPKGVILSIDEYQQWCYDGVNTKMPAEGCEIWCTSIRDEIVFVGGFTKIDGMISKLDVLRCPNCDAQYKPLCSAVKVKYSGVFKNGNIHSEICSKYQCQYCGAIVIKADERLGSICISDIVEE